MQHVGDRRPAQLAAHGVLDLGVDVPQHRPDASTDRAPEVGLVAVHREQRLGLHRLVHIKERDLLRRTGEAPAGAGTVPDLDESGTAQVTQAAARTTTGLVLMLAAT